MLLKLPSLSCFLTVTLICCKDSPQQANVLEAEPEVESHGPSASDNHAHWGYPSQIIVPPDQWKSVSAACNDRADSRQSPIDVPAEFLDGTKHRKKLTIGYEQTRFEVRHNGHTIIFTPKSEQLTVTDDQNQKYRLLQFHLHTPSEHKLGGILTDAEVHFVHSHYEDPVDSKMEDRHLLVIAKMISGGAKEPSPLIPHNLVDIATRRDEIKIQPLLTQDVNPLANSSEQDFLYYAGSLTTPPCTENVQWYVSRNITMTTADDMKNLRAAIGFDNARPVIARNNL